jgi:hypothetical protein
MRKFLSVLVVTLAGCDGATRDLPTPGPPSQRTAPVHTPPTTEVGEQPPEEESEKPPDQQAKVDTFDVFEVMFSSYAREVPEPPLNSQLGDD